MTKKQPTIKAGSLTQPTREDSPEAKHMSLIQAKIDVTRTCELLVELACDIDQVSRDKPDKKVEVEETQPCLLQVLNTTGHEISGIADDIRALIIDIRGSIF